MNFSIIWLVEGVEGRNDKEQMCARGVCERLLAEKKYGGGVFKRVAHGRRACARVVCEKIVGDRAVCASVVCGKNGRGKVWVQELCGKKVCLERTHM